MSRIDREKKTVRKMIDLYCRHSLGTSTTPEEYKALADYACRRLDHCRYGEKKKACKHCPIHCYGTVQREQIRAIMRWVGPRMLFYSPLAALRHLLHW